MCGTEVDNPYLGNCPIKTPYLSGIWFGVAP